MNDLVAREAQRNEALQLEALSGLVHNDGIECGHLETAALSRLLDEKIEERAAAEVERANDDVRLAEYAIGVIVELAAVDGRRERLVVAFLVAFLVVVVVLMRWLSPLLLLLPMKASLVVGRGGGSRTLLENAPLDKVVERDLVAVVVHLLRTTDANHVERALVRRARSVALSLVPRVDAARELVAAAVRRRANKQLHAACLALAKHVSGTFTHFEAL